ncbi:hypothetical protein BJX61DRAFT_505595 [Aspergillus egyptiacus]|nr:hypothetical protein BJX61DRAFT_505595 [Aspergillus egyptiacus]
MAPRGFSATVKGFIPGAHIDGLSLPKENGGIPVMERDLFRELALGDITMYVSEMGMDDQIPEHHPDHDNFIVDRPFLAHEYDLIFCGGGVSKTQTRAAYRDDNGEGSRLLFAQLTFAFNRLRQGGSLVILLHKVESWKTVKILYALSQVADLQAFKPPKCHGIKSSFYLVAKNVELTHEPGKQAVAYWREIWRYLTFRECTDVSVPQDPLGEDPDELAAEIINFFGEEFLELARPVWEVQAKRLRIAAWMKDS